MALLKIRGAITRLHSAQQQMVQNLKHTSPSEGGTAGAVASFYRKCQNRHICQGPPRQEPAVFVSIDANVMREVTPH
jgi:hypothetical protein